MNSQLDTTATGSRPAAPPGGHGGARRTGDYRWVYLWGWPIRATHWLAVASIIVLVVTGFYIGRPYFMTGGEASEHYLMGWMRFLHFVAAGVMVACGILRVYWLFRGNRYERWRALFPFRRRDWGDMWRQFKSYATIRPDKAPHYLGHNPLQQLSYTVLYAVILVQIVTGFALYGQYQPGAGWYLVTEQMRPLFGGIQVVRFVHHVLTWMILVFVPIHVYLALRADLLERSGTISSIISGGRFVRSDIDYVDEQ
jgi:Ni/Fe-hydrogenase 1 B-type cytochrome subunit